MNELWPVVAAVCGAVFASVLLILIAFRRREIEREDAVPAVDEGGPVEIAPGAWIDNAGPHSVTFAGRARRGNLDLGGQESITIGPGQSATFGYKPPPLWRKLLGLGAGRWQLSPLRGDVVMLHTAEGVIYRKIVRVQNSHDLDVRELTPGELLRYRIRAWLLALWGRIRRRLTKGR